MKDAVIEKGREEKYVDVILTPNMSEAALFAPKTFHVSPSCNAARVQLKFSQFLQSIAPKNFKSCDAIFLHIVEPAERGRKVVLIVGTDNIGHLAQKHGHSIDGKYTLEMSYRRMAVFG